jgi:drug/metabolite transporter (DMT)-like permease
MNALRSVVLNGVFLAIIAHALIGLSLVWDKVLLQKRGTQNLLSYVFWLGAISIFGLILIAFGFRMPSFSIAAIAFAAGLLDLIASYFYYSALKHGEASDELAAMGGFGPIATALFALWLLKTPTGGEWPGFLLLTAGGFLMFFAERVPLRKMAPLIVTAAAGFGLMNVLQKIAFNSTNFVSAYVFFTLGTFAGSMALLIPPSWRKPVFTQSEKAPPKSKFWYMVNRFLAGVGSFLIIFAISRTHPSVVQAIAGVRYVIIFIGAYLITRFKPSWFRENFRGRAMYLKAAGTILVVAGLVLTAMHGNNNTTAQ